MKAIVTVMSKLKLMCDHPIVKILLPHFGDLEGINSMEKYNKKVKGSFTIDPQYALGGSLITIRIFMTDRQTVM